MISNHVYMCCIYFQGGGYQCVVGAQTDEFKKEVRAIPGVPIVAISERNKNLILETPSKVSQKDADKVPNSFYIS